MGKDKELIEAARIGNVTVVEKLLKYKSKRGRLLASLRRGPNSNFKDTTGYSALHYAALNGHQYIVELLLAHDASPNIADNKGSTPLHLAAWAGHINITRLMLTRAVPAAQIDLMNNNNETALHYGAQHGHFEIVDLLLKHGADPKVRNVRDETAFDVAAKYGRLETVEVLITTHPDLITIYHGLSCQSTYSSEPTPLHSASRNGHKKVIDALLRAGFPVSIQRSVGSALHEAALCGKVDVVRSLLEAGIDVTLKNSIGLTALQLIEDLMTPVAKEISSLIQQNTRKRNRYKKVPPNRNLSVPALNIIRADHEFQVSWLTDSCNTFSSVRRKSFTSSSTRSRLSDDIAYDFPPPPSSSQEWRVINDAHNAVGFFSSTSDLANGDPPCVAEEGRECYHIYSNDPSMFHPIGTAYTDDLDSTSRLQQRWNYAGTNLSPCTRSSRTHVNTDQFIAMVDPNSKVSAKLPPVKLQAITARLEKVSFSVDRVNHCPLSPSHGLTLSSRPMVHQTPSPDFPPPPPPPPHLAGEFFHWVT